MSRMFVNSLQDGETVDEVYLLADRQLRANRNGDTYFLGQLRDRTGQISGLLWNVNESIVSHINTGDYVRVKGKVQLFQGNLQVILTRIDLATDESVNSEDFIPQSNSDVLVQLERLREILLGLNDSDLSELMQSFLSDDEIVEGLKTAPAGIRLHHAYHGGLLDHIVNLCETASRLTDLYPNVDFNLLLAGIFLHDLGKIRELSYDTSFQYTDEGQLIGHLIIGIEMLDDKIRETEDRTKQDFPKEKALRLKHMIVSHHGAYEFGSPKLPMTPEAIALHHLDNLDAKTNEFQSLIESDPNAASHWTPYQPNMQRKLYKGSAE
ncbi:3'-5' exoribonuclease YhaM [Thalassoglobus neptunius]|uniref:3'-5' exoribonuclease YhaM n=1 Tax=Thalassoglobus neptunius TaxID=1938619 RepID=A0A5C5X869_9PLAN|nr:OB-fold nucleic acid binding domain-containing protein [Thalassoglobus neptunius]TWT59120.1 3'-5' exoribonuclease YhaM [Thalassoglobus neptunius]